MLKICLVGMQTVSYDNDINFKDIEALGETYYVNPATPDELVAACQGATAVLVNKAEMNEYVISRLPDLKYIGVFATGYNNIDIAACKKYGVTCCNAPDYSANAVAQHTAGLLLSAAGALPQYFASVKQGDWIKSKGFCYYSYPMHEVYGKTLGIFGYGHIGRRVAKIADALGMDIIFCNRSHIENTPYKQVSAEEVFRRSDYLSLHCPLTEETAQIINADTLALMKPTATLINTARGGLINEIDLAATLKDGRLRGAYLDVLSQEPMRADNPLRNSDNCFITPHAAWLPQETRQALEVSVANNLQCFLSGKPQNTVTK